MIPFRRVSMATEEIPSLATRTLAQSRPSVPRTRPASYGAGGGTPTRSRSGAAATNCATRRASLNAAGHRRGGRGEDLDELRRAGLLRRLPRFEGVPSTPAALAANSGAGASIRTARPARLLRRRSTAHDQLPPRSPRTPAPARPSMSRTRAASCGAAGKPTRARAECPSMRASQKLSRHRPQRAGRFRPCHALTRKSSTKSPSWSSYRALQLL
jgi:hypothetical protein